jgi:glycerol-3-phosphate acyltransferase PlsY
MLWIILGIIVSYLIGSIPTAYIFGRLLKGIDIRRFGSGNVGATNALRVLGKGPGIAVLVLDILKGFLPVIFLGNFLDPRITFISDEVLRLILGLSCICGHNWTIFLGFKGGKGIATTFGVLLGLSLKITGLKLILGLVILTWLLIFIIVRIVSVASVLSGVALPIYIIIFKQPAILIFAGILLCLFIILRHKSNLTRVLQGKEPRLNFKKST